jgi:hypothetical protein
VSVFIGDNKGSNAIGGFVESFGSRVENFCKFCLSDSHTRQKCFRENELQLRTYENYLESSRLATTMSNNIHNGVKFYSILNDLKHFNVIDGLPVDHMHDYLEGVVQYTFGCMMQKLNSSKTLNVNSVNKHFKEFKYGKHDSENKIPNDLFHQRNINKPGSFKMSASKCWTLLRIFPLIFGETLKDNIYFQNFIKLNELNRLVLQDEFDEDAILYLEEKTNSYLSEFKQIYPHTNITAKQHFLVHYGGNIRKFGPLKHISTMRFESKHSFFKRVAKAINNNRNVTYSLTKRHQLNQYFYLSSAFYFNIPTYGKCESISLAVAKDFKKLLPDQANFENALSYSWVDYQGTKYNRNDVVCISQSNNMPQFGKIDKIVEVNGKIFFSVFYSITRSFIQNMCAYQITMTNSKTCLSIDSLFHYMPLDLYKLKDKFYIIPKYKL